MKKSIYLFLLTLITIVVASCCDEKTKGDKIEDSIEEVGGELEEGAEEIKDKIDVASDDQ